MSELASGIAQGHDLTQPQMNIWSGQLMNTNKPLYNMVMAFHFDGVIAIDRFASAFQKLVDETDVLRLFFKTHKGSAKQFFHPRLKSTHQFIDFSDDVNPLTSFESWIEEHKGRLFQDNEVLYHSALLKLNSKHFVWYFNHHHLITDGTTILLLYNRLKENYERGNEEATKPSEFQYKKISQELPFNSVPDSNAHWEQYQAKGIPLPTLYGARNELAGARSTRVTVTLGRERTSKLKSMATEPPFKAWNVEMALFNLFQTILNVLVYKVSGNEEFFSGFASHNRAKVSHTKTPGLFMELLPAYVEVEKQDTLAELFEKTRDESLNALKNASQSKPPTDLLRSFNAVLNFIPGHFKSFDEIPVTCDWLHSGFSDPSHHIRLQVHDFSNQGDYQLQFDLNDEVFDEDTQQRLPKHFLKIVTAMIENPNQKIEEISLITDEEIELIESWNDTSVDYPPDETLLTKFQAQVKKSPDATALLFDGQLMTYGELDQRSNQFANRLLNEGVRQGNVVAVSLERSFDVYMAIYGLLKIGAVYLPIDTEIPEQRLQFILEDAQVKSIVLNHENFNSYDLTGLLRPSIDLNSTDESVLNFKGEITQDDLAYIIYTSGSTGQPKGVACAHKGICNRLNWMSDYNPLSTSDRMMLKTPLTFDVSLPELFWPIQLGASVVIEKHNGHKNSDQLVDTIVKNRVTTIHFVPSLLTVFLQNAKANTCKNVLKRIFCSGEALPVSTANRVLKNLKVDVLNLYGPTEASVEVLSWKCRPNESRSSIPIGYPVANAQLHILDESGMKTPLGVVGELYISGPQVAIGYINNEELNKEAFPIKKIDDQVLRLYRTGDLARQRTDGAIEFLGRLDHQVKVRGFRIELSEIEENLSRMPDIHQAITVLRKKMNGSNSLAVFYTGEELDKDQIKQFLSGFLPDYMIPNHYVRVDGFSFNTSGKVDRKELPFDLLEVEAKEVDYVAPETDLETLIVEIWEEVLKREKIGTNEDFIQIGGDSLAAISITSRLLEQIELDIEINLVFQAPTIAQYAKKIEQLMISLMDED